MYPIKNSKTFLLKNEEIVTVLLSSKNYVHYTYTVLRKSTRQYITGNKVKSL